MSEKGIMIGAVTVMIAGFVLFGMLPLIVGYILSQLYYIFVGGTIVPGIYNKWVLGLMILVIYWIFNIKPDIEELIL